MSKREGPPPLDTAAIRKLAVDASCDPRTILAVAKGEPIRGLARMRARDALLAAGYKVPSKGDAA